MNTIWIKIKIHESLIQCSNYWRQIMRGKFWFISWNVKNRFIKIFRLYQTVGSFWVHFSQIRFRHKIFVCQNQSSLTSRDSQQTSFKIQQIQLNVSSLSMCEKHETLNLKSSLWKLKVKFATVRGISMKARMQNLP